MGLTSTSFTSENQPANANRNGRPKSPATIVKDAIFKATGKDLEAYWAWVVEQSQKEGGESFVRLIVERTTPTLKAQMMTVNVDGFPRAGTAVEQAEAVLAAVMQGVIPLDFAGPMLTMIQIIDTAKGGSLGNSGLDLSTLYAGTDNGMVVAANFAKQVAAVTKPKQVIEVVATAKPAPPAAQGINEAIETEATSILDGIGGTITDKAHAQRLLDSSTKALSARFPSNTYDSIKAALVKVLNARLEAAP